MIVSLQHYLFVSVLIFSIGTMGFLTRRNVIVALMSLELMLNAVIVNIVAFWRHLGPTQVSGQMFAVSVFAVAAAEAAVGLALIISIYRRRGTVVVEDVRLLKW